MHTIIVAPLFAGYMPVYDIIRLPTWYQPILGSMVRRVSYLPVFRWQTNLTSNISPLLNIINSAPIFCDQFLAMDNINVDILSHRHRSHARANGQESQRIGNTRSSLEFPMGWPNIAQNTYEQGSRRNQEATFPPGMRSAQLNNIAGEAFVPRRDNNQINISPVSSQTQIFPDVERALRPENQQNVIGDTLDTEMGRNNETMFEQERQMRFSSDNVQIFEVNHNIEGGQRKFSSSNARKSDVSRAAQTLFERRGQRSEHEVSSSNIAQSERDASNNIRMNSSSHNLQFNDVHPSVLSPSARSAQQSQQSPQSQEQYERTASREQFLGSMTQNNVEVGSASTGAQSRPDTGYELDLMTLVLEIQELYNKAKHSRSQGTQNNINSQKIDAICMICGVRSPCAKLMPCEHKIACVECSLLLFKCLRCNIKIEERYTDDGQKITEKAVTRAEVDYLKKKLKKYKEASTCNICLDGYRQIVFGCGHSACENCARKLQRCHICRAPLTTKIHTY